MNLIENIREAVTSIKVNLLRTVLTGAIIAIGISSLVGMLTAIDGIKAQIADSFAGLGANSFDIKIRVSVEVDPFKKVKQRRSIQSLHLMK